MAALLAPPWPRASEAADARAAEVQARAAAAHVRADALAGQLATIQPASPATGGR
jgi:hypothetical protein